MLNKILDYIFALPAWEDFWRKNVRIGVYFSRCAFCIGFDSTVGLGDIGWPDVAETDSDFFGGTK